MAEAPETVPRVCFYLRTWLAELQISSSKGNLREFNAQQTRQERSVNSERLFDKAWRGGRRWKDPARGSRFYGKPRTDASVVNVSS